MKTTRKVFVSACIVALVALILFAGLDTTWPRAMGTIGQGVSALNSWFRGFGPWANNLADWFYKNLFAPIQAIPVLRHAWMALATPPAMLIAGTALLSAGKGLRRLLGIIH